MKKQSKSKKRIKRKKTAARKPKKRPVGRPRKDLAKAARERGKRGEREAAALWEEYGYKAERSVQVRGGKDAADIVIDGVSEFFHAEVKNVEQFSLYPALRQAQADAGPFQTPFVMHERNGQKFVVVLDAEDFIRLVKQAGYVPPPVREIELDDTTPED